jgi:perosamine synthetase
LRAENIGVNVHYIPVHQHPYYRERFKSKEGYPVAEDAYERLISLPMFHAMTAQDVEDVIHAVTKIVDHYRKAYDPGGCGAHMRVGQSTQEEA